MSVWRERRSGDVWKYMYMCLGGRKEYVHVRCECIGYICVMFVCGRGCAGCEVCVRSIHGGRGKCEYGYVSCMSIDVDIEMWREEYMGMYVCIWKVKEVCVCGIWMLECIVVYECVHVCV